WAWKFYRAATVEHVLRSAPLLLGLNLASRGCFVELARAWGDFTLEEKGIVMVCNSDEGLEHEVATAQMGRQLGLPVEILDAKEIAAMEPDIRMTVAGGIYFPKDAYLAPWQFMAALKKRVPDVRWKTAVSLRPDGNRVASDIEADEY